MVYGIQTIEQVFTFTWTGFSKKDISQGKFSGKNVVKLFLASICIGLFAL
jgi:hypothetical protein